MASIAQEVRDVLSDGVGRDKAYEIMAAKEGLFHVAFYGHCLPDREADRKAHRRLNYIWRLIRKEWEA